MFLSHLYSIILVTFLKISHSDCLFVISQSINVTCLFVNFSTLDIHSGLSHPFAETFKRQIRLTIRIMLHNMYPFVKTFKGQIRLSVRIMLYIKYKR